MNNSGPLWSYKKFKSKEEARTYCLSEECKRHISYLDGLVQSLYDKAQKEVPVQAGHGYPMEAPSSLEASYVDREADRLRTLRKYFKGDSPRPGYLWEYDTMRHEVYQKIDTSNLSKKHPVFIEYVNKQMIRPHRIDEAYKLWSSQFGEKSSCLNLQFKLAYFGKMDDLVPDQCKLLDMVKKPLDNFHGKEVYLTLDNNPKRGTYAKKKSLKAKRSKVQT